MSMEHINLGYDILVTRYMRWLGILMLTTQGVMMIGRVPKVVASTQKNSMIFQDSKKQSSMSLSTTKVEYIEVGLYYFQLLWMKQMVSDYGIIVRNLFLLYNNANAICISKDPIQHLRTKHIDIRHHFIRDLVKFYTIVATYQYHSSTS